MTITIVGAGAIGGVLGAYLIKAGRAVTFIDVSAEHVRKMKTDGLTIVNKDSSFTVPVQAYTWEDYTRSGLKPETVLLCVKAQHTSEALSELQSLIQRDSVIVSCQNGLCEDQIAAAVGRERTIGCFVNLFADYLEPGKINYGGEGALYLGELDGRITDRVLQLKEILSAWGQAKVTDNIWGYLWSKLAYGALLAATALTNETIADLIEDKHYRPVLLNVAAEILAVADRKNVKVMPFDGWNPALVYPVNERDSKQIDGAFQKLAGRLRTYTKVRTGIWRDLTVRHRPTEVPSHLEPILAEAEHYNLLMPLTASVLKMIKEIEQGLREVSLNNLDELLKKNSAPS